MCLWISIPKLFCHYLAAVRWDTPILYCEPACHDVPSASPLIVDQGRDKNNTGVPAGLPVFVQHQNLFPRLIAGTTPFWGGSWRQIWARDVAFLHFSQTASLRSHNGPGNVDEPHFFGALFPHCEAEGRRFGKNEEMRHLGPKCASRNHPKTGWFLRSKWAVKTSLLKQEHSAPEYLLKKEKDP